MASIRVRFAPSPTGTLHVGGARTALFNWLYARAQGGTFVLRIEDTDRERSTAESHAQILRSMRWMGLDWDEGPEAGGAFGPYVQSERKAFYDEQARALLEAGDAYRCYCTPEELEDRRSSQSGAGYDGRCRELSAAQRKAFEDGDRTSVLRIRMPDEGAIKWTDIVHGDLSFDCEVLDDWVAVKSDGYPTYNFAVVVDDGLMEISHVLRGDDHLSNTPRQIHLFKTLGFRIPKFGHMPMILGSDGKRLSKRHGAASVEDFRDAHFLPEALVNYLALLGWSPGTDEEFFQADSLIKKFSLKRLNKSAAVFDPAKLAHINGEHMKARSLDEKTVMAWEILEAAGVVPAGDAAERARLASILGLMGNRFSHLADSVPHLSAYFSEDYPIDPEADSLDTVVAERLTALAGRFEILENFDAEGLEAALRAYAEELGIKAGELIHPARFATTGQKVGPSVFDSLAALGKERVLRRLRSPGAA
jgi:glutamyl-tRNA synthetase